MTFVAYIVCRSIVARDKTGFKLEKMVFRYSLYFAYELIFIVNIYCIYIRTIVIVHI